ncbi:MAG: hypothetical protein K2R98_17215 [Gemmataceae bacterium]|nr:hypothetical protein [Gemmataceae bacterium]
MLQAIRNCFNQGFFMVALPLFAQGKGAEGTTQKTKSATGEAFGDLVGAWWLWAGIIAILGLLGLLYYLRNKSDD